MYRGRDEFGRKPRIVRWAKKYPGCVIGVAVVPSLLLFALWSLTKPPKPPPPDPLKDISLDVQWNVFCEYGLLLAYANARMETVARMVEPSNRKPMALSNRFEATIEEGVPLIEERYGLEHWQVSAIWRRGKGRGWLVGEWKPPPGYTTEWWEAVQRNHIESM